MTTVTCLPAISGINEEMDLAVEAASAPTQALFWLASPLPTRLLRRYRRALLYCPV